MQGKNRTEVVFHGDKMLAPAPAYWRAGNARVARQFDNAGGTFRYRPTAVPCRAMAKRRLSRVFRPKYLHSPVGQQWPNSPDDDVLVVRRAEVRFERGVVAVVLDQHETRFVRQTLESLIANTSGLAERLRSN